MKILCYPGDCFWATLWSKSPPPPGATPFVIIANHLHLSLAIYAPATHIAVTWDPCGRLGNLAVLGLSNIWASVCVCVCVCGAEGRARNREWARGTNESWQHKLKC
jgi:hypothetical protein